MNKVKIDGETYTIGNDGKYYEVYIDKDGAEHVVDVPKWEHEFLEQQIKRDSEYEEFCRIGRINAEHKNERLAKEGGEMFAFILFVIFLICVASYFGIRI